MRRIALALFVAALAAAVFAAPATAACLFCPDSVSLQTPDGLAWSSGKPLTVVVSAHRATPDIAFPTSGLVVVMRTDGDRTKCLDVPLKLVRVDGDTGLYAGVFYPFRAAAYDGKIGIGDETSDIRFDVATSVSAAAGDWTKLPIGSTEEPDAFVPRIAPAIGQQALVAGALGIFAAIGGFLMRRRWSVAVVG